MPSARKIAVIDAASAILLTASGVFTRFADRFQVVMAAAVYDEVTPHGYPGADRLRQYHAHRRYTVASPDTASVDHHRWPAGMHSGERATIALHLARKADFVVIDDGKGAGFCRRERIPYINALLVPRILYFSGDVSADWAMEKAALIREKGHYSETVVRFASRATAAELAPFFQGHERTRPGSPDTSFS